MHNSCFSGAWLSFFYRKPPGQWFSRCGPTFQHLSTPEGAGPFESAMPPDRVCKGKQKKKAAGGQEFRHRLFSAALNTQQKRGNNKRRKEQISLAKIYRGQLAWEMARRRFCGSSGRGGTRSDQKGKDRCMHTCFNTDRTTTRQQEELVQQQDTNHTRTY